MKSIIINILAKNGKKGELKCMSLLKVVQREPVQHERPAAVSAAAERPQVFQVGETAQVSPVSLQTPEKYVVLLIH